MTASSVILESADNTTMVDRAQALAIAAEIGLHSPNDVELQVGRDIAAGLIDPSIPEPHMLRQVERHSGIAALVYREKGDVTGMYALLLLSKEGLSALRRGAFNAGAPTKQHIAGLNEPVAAHYGWGVAATTKSGARAALSCITALHDSLCPDIPYYVRAATDDGRRVIMKGGCEPVSWGDPDLYVSNPPAAAR